MLTQLELKLIDLRITAVLGQGSWAHVPVAMLGEPVEDQGFGKVSGDLRVAGALLHS